MNRLRRPGTLLRRAAPLIAAAGVVFGAGLAALPAMAAFPGDNGKIVFASNQSGSFEIYSMNPDGSGVAQLTNLHQCARGAWVSPGGTRIAFHSTPPGAVPCAGGRWDVYTMNADGTGITQLTNSGYNAVPAWSPDGTKIAFVSNRNRTTTGSCQVFEMNADGSNPTQVSQISTSTGLGGVSWSPDGAQIAYGTAVGTTFCPGPTGTAQLQIHVMNAADGSNDTVLESEAFISGIPFNTSRHPDWSPDGSQITYASTRNGDLQIWSMNADGSGKTQVTSDPNTPENFSRFSPDGTAVVFQAAWSQGTQLRIVGVDGSHEVKVTNGESRDVQPSWGPATED